MMSARVSVRVETPDDFAAVRIVNREAFGQADEADLVEQLRDDGEVVASLVAEVDNAVVGHILFSRLPIHTSARKIAGAALAPVAVLPRFQRLGIGSVLVRSGLRHCAESGCEAVVVLGHPAYYPRFGFSAALAERLDAPFSGAAFMALELAPGALADGGAVRYAAAFGV